jgi:hypothetical protein
MSTIMAESLPNPFSYGEGDLEAERRDSAPVWIKVPARSTIRVCLQKELPLRFALHFVDGHPQLCWGRGHCGHCTDRRGKKVHYVYPAFDLSRRSAGLIDLPPHAESGVAEGRDRHGFVRGMAFELKKEGGVENGRICCVALHQILDVERFGEPIDAVAVLCRQYGLERSLFEVNADVP